MKKSDRFYLKLLKNIFLLTLPVIIGCYSSHDKQNLEVEKDIAYPRWLKSGDYKTDQTSGIVFIGTTTSGYTNNKPEIKNFLLADDIGKVHHLKITDDTVFSFTNVYLSKDVQTFLDPFPKLDFEEITYDKYTNSVYLSIEGNEPDPQKYTGIYKIYFSSNDVNSDTISAIEKLSIEPEELFLKYTGNNIGYEGFTVDKNYFYLGLEGFSENNIFADSTLLFIVDKKNLKIIKQISTKPLGIHTICGLYSDNDNSIYGVDRNNKKLFHLNIDASLKIKDFEITNIATNIPGYPMLDYIAAIESITMDNEKNIYMVDDPWKTFFVPSQSVLSQLDIKTVNNFKDFIPVIFKFKLKN